MHNYVGEMEAVGRVPPGAVDLLIQLKREPRQRVPIHYVGGCNGPANILPIDSAHDVKVPIDVVVIVVIHEIRAEDVPIIANRGRSQDQARQEAGTVAL